MMRGRLRSVAERLRTAVEGGALAEASVLLPEFRDALGFALAELRPGDGEALRLVGEARDCLGRLRQLALCQRAQLALEIETLACADCYAPARATRRTWEVRG